MLAVILALHLYHLGFQVRPYMNVVSQRSGVFLRNRPEDFSAGVIISFIASDRTWDRL